MNLNFLSNLRTRVLITIPAIIGMITVDVLYFAFHAISIPVLAWGQFACGFYMWVWLGLYWFVYPYLNNK